MGIPGMALHILQRAQQTRQRTPDAGVAIACDSCLKAVEIADETRVSEISALIQHAQFEHVAGAGLVVQMTVELLTNYELNHGIEGPPRTEHERLWRVAREA